ncbi:MAG TPA: hypothetical protein GXZ90_08890 [Clostridiales bacterium]|nr:hypothetical protein [Clostridiales bacterium]
MAEIMKAASPHLDFKTMRLVNLFTSFMDFMGSFSNFKSSPDLKSCDLDNNEINFEDLLSSIRPVCNDNEKQMVDTFLNLFNAMQMMDTYKTIMEATNMAGDFNSFNDNDFESNDSNNKNGNQQTNNNNNMMEMLKTLLPSDQVDNFENISMVLNAMSYDNKESVDKRSENDE